MKAAAIIADIRGRLRLSRLMDRVRLGRLILAEVVLIGLGLLLARQYRYG